MLTSKGLKFLLTRLKTARTNLTYGLIALACVTVVNLSIPQFIKNAIPLNSSEELQNIVWILISLFVIQGIFGYFRVYFFNICAYKISTTLRKDTFAKILKNSIPFFDAQRPAELVSQINADIQILQDVIASKFSLTIRYFLQLFGGIALMLYISFKLSLFLILAFPIIVIFSIYLAKKLKAYSKAIQESLGQSSIIAEESFLAIRVIKLFSASPLINGLYAKEADKILNLGRARGKVSAFFQSFVSFLLYALIVIFLAFGVHLTLSQQLSIQDLSAFIMYALIVAVSFSLLASNIDEISKALAVCERLLEIENADHQDRNELFKAPVSEQAPQISFKDASFLYPESNNPVFNNLSFTLKANAFNVISGPSGVGKTTLLQTLLGFYPLSSGTIDYQPSIAQEQISFVPHNSQIFDLSIADNLKIANPNVSNEQIVQTLETVNLLELINNNEQGIDQQCGSRGLKLSAGQQQRLAIARALVRQPKLIVLDEATSALDQANEQQIINLLQKLKETCTIIFISHQQAVREAGDQIVLLEDSQTIKVGQHQELQQQSDLYRLGVR